MTLKFDSLGYAPCHGYWIGRGHSPVTYYIMKGGHPHDPDGNSAMVVNGFTSIAEVMGEALERRKDDLREELDRLEGIDYEPCPDCGDVLRNAPGGDGAECANANCDYWFCY